MARLIYIKIKLWWCWWIDCIFFKCLNHCCSCLRRWRQKLMRVMLSIVIFTLIEIIMEI